MSKKTISYVELFITLNAVASQVAMQVLRALQDDVLDGPEVAGIVKAAIQGLRMTGVSHADLDQIKMITTKSDYDALPFKDGDVMIYGPSELTSKLKIKT